VRFDLIPSMETASADAAPSRVRELIPNPPAARRTLFKGLAVAAISATLVPFEWALSRRAARAAGAPTSEWTDPHCADYGVNYTPDSCNWWAGDPAQCYGGWRRGGKPCNADNRHFDGHWEYTHTGIWESVWSQRITTSCNGKNAWRWSAPSGNTFRCSDAWTHVYWTDNDYADVTVAVCFVGQFG
jgi:hypothetical protein